LSQSNEETIPPIVEPSSRGQHFLVFILLTALALLIRHWVGRVPIDDAYITFRHAERLFKGLGWGYNDGGTVIASSTPLWTMLLAPLSPFLPEIARHLGILFDSLIPFILYSSFFLVSGSVLFSTVVGLLYLFSPDSALCAPTGMETPLFNFLMCLSVFLLQKGWLKSATLCTALLPLVRMDGSLFVVLTWPFFFSKKRFPFYLAVQLLPIVLWFFYKSVLGDSGFLPSSLAGKLSTYSQSGGPSLGRLLGVGDFWASLFFKTLQKDPLLNLPRAILWIGLVAGGAFFFIRRRSPLAILPLFSVFYSIACVLVEVPLFSWYYVPPIPGICVGVAGILCLGPKEFPIGDRSKRILAGVGVVFAILMTLGGVRALYEFNQDRAPAWVGRVLFPNERERANKDCAEIVLKDLEERPMEGNPKVLVHDLGVIGYYLPEARMIDSAGIATPEVAEFYRDNPGVWRFDFSTELIEFTDPDFFICAARHGRLNEIWETVQVSYEEIGRATGETWAYPFVLVCRKRDAPLAGK